MTINLTPLLQAIISLAVALITYKLIPWIKSKTTVNQQSALESAARIAVFAAEQLYGAGKGDEKFRYACDYLEKHGFSVDQAAIEAAVHQAFNYTMPILTPAEDSAGKQEEAEKTGE